MLVSFICCLIFASASDWPHRNMSRSSSNRSKGDLFPGTVQPPRCKGIHVYLFCSKEGATYLSHTSGDVTAEELCFLAAKAVGESRYRLALERMWSFCVIEDTTGVRELVFFPQVSLPFAMFCLLCTIHCQLAGTVQVTPSPQKFTPLLYSTTV